MCFSLAGRLQTRLASLLVAALLTALMVGAGHDERYLPMFLVMLVLAIDLDVGVYSHLITYQSRWLTYLLGIAEFGLIVAVVRWWLAGSLPVLTITAFYALSWIGGLLVVNMVLPVLDPSWREHGGEIGRQRVRGLQSPGRNPFAPVARTWRHLASAPPGTLLLLALVPVTLLAWTVLPSNLDPLDVGATLLGTLVPAILAALVGIGRRGSLRAAITLGLLVALLVRGPGPGAYVLAGGLAAIAYLVLTIDRRTVLNAALCGVLGALLLVPGTYTSAALWGNSLVLPLLLANTAILLAYRTRRLPLVVSFGAVIAVYNGIEAYRAHEAFTVAVQVLLPTSLVFLGGFVLPDLRSTPRSRPAQIALGVAVAGGGLVLQALSVGLPFVVAILAGNAVTGLIAVVALRLRARRTTGERSTVGRRRHPFPFAIVPAALVLGAYVHGVTGVDPAVLALPAAPALAGGRAIPRFADVTAQSGIVLRHTGDPAEGSPAVGTGATWGDFNNDGRLDLYVTDHLGASHLYRNNGDGTFTDVAGPAGVAHPGLHATSATFVDYDNDGHLDLYVGIAHGPNVLYHNNGDGTFTNVTAHSGLGDTGRTMSTAWGDYNGDGYLDVFVVNYPSDAITFDANSLPTQNTRMVLHLPHPTSHLYRNNGNGTFTDVTSLLGDGATWGFGFSAVWFDYNNDGRPDLYMVNDFGGLRVPNVLWRNDGPGGPHGWRFTQVQANLGVDTRFNPMGAATGDYNNDGWLDLALSNIGPNLLYLNHHGTQFTDVARRAGVTNGRSYVSNMMNPSLTWGVTFGDFNNDGWPDLFLAAGAMDGGNVPQPDKLYLNDHHGRFVDVSAAAGVDDPGQGRSVAVGDYNGDGRLDLFVANYGQPPHLYRALPGGQTEHWIRLDLEGTRSNRQGVGARVTIYAPGLPPQIREVQIGQGLGTANETTLHFGLGSAARVQRVNIRWPSGIHQVLPGMPADRTVHVREPGKSRWAT